MTEEDTPRTVARPAEADDTRRRDPARRWCPRRGAMISGPCRIPTRHSNMSGTGSYFRDKTVLVTGASSGIGEEIAWQLGQSGAKLTLAARRRATLENLADRIAKAGA